MVLQQGSGFCTCAQRLAVAQHELACVAFARQISNGLATWRSGSHTPARRRKPSRPLAVATSEPCLQAVRRGGSERITAFLGTTTLPLPLQSGVESASLLAPPTQTSGCASPRPFVHALAVVLSQVRKAEALSRADEGPGRYGHGMGRAGPVRDTGSFSSSEHSKDMVLKEALGPPYVDLQ